MDQRTWGQDYNAEHTAQMLGTALADDNSVAISHGSHEYAPPNVIERSERLYAGTTNAVKARSARHIQRYFAGLNLVPGLVHVPLWRPESDDDVVLATSEHTLFLAGVEWKS